MKALTITIIGSLVFSCCLAFYMQGGLADYPFDVGDRVVEKSTGIEGVIIRRHPQGSTATYFIAYKDNNGERHTFAVRKWEIFPNNKSPKRTTTTKAKRK